MKAMNFIWPIDDQWNHCNVRSVLQRPDIEPYWTELYQAINGIQWDDLINLHNHEHNHRMSMSVAISERIDDQLTELGAKDNVPIFSEKLVDGKEDRYRIWKKLGPIAIDYAFGHPDGLRWKLNRLASSIIPNKHSMENQCQLGVLIVATESLRKTAKFDAKANWETAIEDLNIMAAQLQAPIFIMGLKDPETFTMIDYGKGKKPRSYVKKLV
jgi:hypothetical protein